MRIGKRSECLRLFALASGMFVTLFSFSIHASAEPTPVEKEAVRQLIDTASLSSESLGFLKWTPDGAYLHPVRSDCRHEVIEQRLRAAGSDLNQQAKALNRWMSLCGENLLGTDYDTYKTLVKFATMDYRWESNPRITAEWIPLSDGRKVGALVAFKKDGRKRPLILARCGVFCDADDGSTTTMILTHLFEESPFNVIMLGSTTGAQFAKANGIFSIAGFDEGLQAVEVLREIQKDPEVMAHTDSIHLLGISLGGLGTLYAALFASEVQPELPMPVSSALSMCSVVDLEPQLEAAFSRSPRGLFFRFLTQNVFRDVFNAVPILGEYLRPGQKWSRHDLYKTATQASFDYFREKYESGEGFPLEPYRGSRLDTLKEFWRLNRFQDVAALNRVPTLVIHARDDYLVPSRLNASKLAAREDSLSAVKTLEIPGGNHCAFGLALGWPTYSAMLRGYFLSHSSEAAITMFAPRFTWVEIEPYLRSWAWPMNVRIWPGEWFGNIRFKVLPGKTRVSVMVDIYNPTSSAGHDVPCSTMGGNSTYRECFREVRGTMPLSALEPLGIRLTKDKGEAERMTRWLNSRSAVVDAEGQQVVGTRTFPSHLKFESLYEFY